MGKIFKHRAGHYSIIILAGLSLFFVNLGSHTLWDIDESHNAECAREMMVADDWIVPTFNFALRTDKPAMQYWLIILAYQILGVSEFAARVWSAMAATGSLLITYELGRRMFDSSTALLSSLILGSTIMFCVSAHAVTPDALLIFFTLAALFVFWNSDRHSQHSALSTQHSSWLIPYGIITGLAVLTKGPVGWLLPSTVIGIFLFWEGRLKTLLSKHMGYGAFLFLAIAVPWYVYVANRTDGGFLEGFVLKHNVGRFLDPMEGHSGSIFYHPIVFLAAFAPWSIFIGPTLWNAFQSALNGQWQTPRHHSKQSRIHRFLCCWMGVWVVFFSLAGTKLPNYILPMYPAAALLTGNFLIRWHRGEWHVPRWIMNISLGSLLGIGLAVSLGLLVSSGTIPLSVLDGRHIAPLAPWAALGLILICTAMVAFWFLRQQERTALLCTVAVGSICFVALTAGFGPRAADQEKYSDEFAALIEENLKDLECRVGTHGLYRPSLVFYTRREVKKLDLPEQVYEHLACPVQTFLIIPSGDWANFQALAPESATVLERRQDFMNGKEVLLITNRTWPMRAVTKR